MPAHQVLSDADDPRLRPYLHLNDPALRREREAAEGLFVVEGRLALEAVLSSPLEVPVLSVLVLRSKLHLLAKLAGGPPPGAVPVYAVEDEVMKAVAGYPVHRGVLAVAARPAPRAPEEVLAGACQRLVLAVEGVNDQENLGSLFRNAAAFGAGAVLMDPRCADPFYRRTVRVSLGHAARVPSCRVEPWPAGLRVLDRGGFRLVALTPSAEAPDVRVVARRLLGQKVAVVVGAEGPGLSPEVLGLGERARIAMAAGVDSLNVATAAAVAMHCLSSPA